MNRLQEFMDECYDDKGKIISHDYEKCEPHKKCRMCKDYQMITPSLRIKK